MKFNINSKTLKVIYIVPSSIVALLAIAAAYLRYREIAVALIVVGSIIVLAGSVLYSYLYRIEREEERKKSLE